MKLIIAIFYIQTNYVHKNEIVIALCNKCNFMTGYSGVNCEIEEDPCDSSPCYNGATCNKVSVNSYTCDCVYGKFSINCPWSQRKMETEQKS